MNLTFLRFLKKGKTRRESNVAVAPRPIVAIEKPASERLGRTFLPNVGRGAEPEPETSLPVPATAGTSPTVVVEPLAVSGIALVPNSGTPATTVLPGMPSQGGAPSPAHKISPGTDSGLGVPRPNESRTEKNDRTIALPLVDLSAHIPDGMLSPLQIDPERRILFKATEIERGMASGRPSVRLRSIYQQAPELFSCEVSPEDTTQVILPVAQVLEQFASFKVRPDQLRDPVIPQMETPFLKVTMEDSERFRTSIEAVSPSEPAVKSAVEPSHVSSLPTSFAPLHPTAPAATSPPAAQPAAELKPIKPIRLSLPTENKEVVAPSAAPSAPPTPSVEAAPPRPIIKPRFSPNGIGVPVPERVPASSGPPVPTPLPSPFAPPPPSRIPFKVAPPSDDLRASVASPSAAAPATLTPAIPSPRPSNLPETVSSGPRLQLPLRAVLRGIVPLQVSGPTDEVPESAQVDFPFSIIEPQLSLGKISLSPGQFVAALPAEFRERFKIEDPQTPIPLPLEEVLQHLPNDTLRTRADQNAPELVSAFETPFSQKAAEDAERFQTPVPKVVLDRDAPRLRKNVESAQASTLAINQGAALTEARLPVAEVKPAFPKPAANLTPEKTLLPGTSVAPKTPEVTISALQSVERSSLQRILETDEALDPKSIVAHAGRLSGVRACAIMFSDGLSLAENFPREYKVDALCAIAPTIVQKIGTQIPGANLGPLTSITLFCAKESVSFFARENICLAVLHAGADEVESETRARLSAVVKELGRMYGSQPNDAHQPNA